MTQKIRLLALIAAVAVNGTALAALHVAMAESACQQSQVQLDPKCGAMAARNLASPDGQVLAMHNCAAARSL